MSSPTESTSAIGRDTSHAGDDMTADDRDLGDDQRHLSDGPSDGEEAPARDELRDERLERKTTDIQPEGDGAVDEAILGGPTEGDDPQQTSRSSPTTPEVPPDSEFGDGGATPDPQDEHARRATPNDLNVGQGDLDVGQGDLDGGQGDLEGGYVDLGVSQGDLDVGQGDLDLGHEEGIPNSGDGEPSRLDQTGADVGASHPSDDHVITGEQELQDDTVETKLAANPDGDLQDLGPEVSQHAPPGTADGSHYEKINLVGVHGAGRKHISLAVNQSAIEASARNKLPITEVKGLVTRVSRPTESSSHKTRIWYKNEHYVDKDSYSWKNMPLFDDHQRHLWTTEGAVRQTFKK
ncbi:unnamed protein product [Lymnaea stagnalis]|uniref:Uncharacterized protein n=1 Tax=Lymnaea stagnalis TaxID=6523 RepID=A0AAV2HLB7_LYMST